MRRQSSCRKENICQYSTIISVVGLVHPFLHALIKLLSSSVASNSYEGSLSLSFSWHKTLEHASPLLQQDIFLSPRRSYDISCFSSRASQSRPACTKPQRQFTSPVRSSHYSTRLYKGHPLQPCRQSTNETRLFAIFFSLERVCVRNSHDPVPKLPFLSNKRGRFYFFRLSPHLALYLSTNIRCHRQHL